MVSKLTMNSPCTHWVITPLPPVYQALVESLKKRDDIVQKQFNRQDVRLACHWKYLDNHQQDIKQIVDDQVCMVKRMTDYEEKACRCGDDSDRLSHLSYGEPPVASSQVLRFPARDHPSLFPFFR